MGIAEVIILIATLLIITCVLALVVGCAVEIAEVISAFIRKRRTKK